MPTRMIAAIAALVLSTSAALAQEVKVGVVLPYTGIGAELAQQMDRGMELYLKLNADQLKPYIIKLIKRDSKAPNGAEARLRSRNCSARTRSMLLPAGSIRLMRSRRRRSSPLARSSGS